VSPRPPGRDDGWVESPAYSAAMRYFITGATGFLGGVLTRQLAEEGHSLIALARDPEKAGDLVEFGIDVRWGDVGDKESMRQAVVDAHLQCPVSRPERPGNAAPDIDGRGS